VSNLEQIQELYGAFGRGDIEPVLAALAPDVEWVEGDIEGLAYGGVHRGPEAVSRDVFAQIPGADDSFELVPQEWVDGGDTIVMLGRVTVRLDGRESSQTWPRRGGSRTAGSRASSLSRTRWPRRVSWARSADSTPAERHAAYHDRALADSPHAFLAVAGSGALAEKSAPRRQAAARIPVAVAPPEPVRGLVRIDVGC